jgi:hypothetical protein
MSVSIGFNPSIGTAVANVLSDVRVHSFLVIVTGY